MIVINRLVPVAEHVDRWTWNILQAFNSWCAARVVRGSNFFNPSHQTTDPTQPNPSQSKNFGPTNQPNPQPIPQSNSIQPTTNLWT